MFSGDVNSMAGASPRALDVRWMRRYRFFWTAGIVILTVQVFLAYVFLTIDTSRENPNQEFLSGRGRLNVEVRSLSR